MQRDPFNKLLHGMLPFHNHFRMEHAMILRGLPESQSAPKTALLTLMQQTLGLCHHLEMHHSIEEAHIFPLLAAKMPSFAKNSDHTNEHKAMHENLEHLEKYAAKVMQDLRSSAGKRAEAEGSGQVIKRAGDVEDEEASDEDETGVAKRKAWPTSVYDQEKFETLVKGLSSTLFPHLEAEEASLKAENLKKHGWTAQELARIPL